MFPSGGFFFNRSGVIAPLPGGYAGGFDIYPDQAIAAWRFNSDGTVDRRITTGWQIPVHWWFDPKQAGIGSGFYIRATVLDSTETPDFDDVGVWLSLSSPRTFSLATTGGGTHLSRLLIEISTGASNATVVTSGTYEIEVESAQ